MLDFSKASGAVVLGGGGGVRSLLHPELGLNPLSALALPEDSGWGGWRWGDNLSCLSFSGVSCPQSPPSGAVG